MRQPLTNNENSNQNSNLRSDSQSLNQSMNKQSEHQRHDGPIDLIKKEGLFVDLTNQTQSIQPNSNNDLNSSNNNVVKEKIRKQIANTPVIIENPEANRFQAAQQMINNTNNSRVQYYSNESQQTDHLLSASVVNNNANNPSPLVNHLQMDTNSSPINSNEILHNDQDLMNSDKVVYENSWFEDQNKVQHLKDQLEQQIQTSNLSQQAPINAIPTKPLNRCPTIPAHVFNSGEKFRRHSDSTAEILNQQNMNHNYHQPNGLINHHPLNNSHQMDSIQTSSTTNNIQMQRMNNSLHSQQPMDYDSSSNQIESNNNLVNFDYLKRKQLRVDTETSANGRTMETIPESQMINSTVNTTTDSNYLQPSNHLLNNHHQVFYNNNNCNTTGQLTYQSHSVPTTPTVVNQQFFNHQRLDLNNVNTQQLDNNHEYHEQLSNQISHHHSNGGHQLNPPHSLPCTPKQQPTSFTFSPHQVQHYQQGQQQQPYHSNHYNSSPNTPITPVTPTNCANQQYQDNLIGVQRQNNNLHPSQAIQQSVNQQSANLHKNILYPTPSVEFNNTICPRNSKFSQQHNLNYVSTMIGNHHQFLDSNDNHITTPDHLDNTYSTIINDDYMVNETATDAYNAPQQQFDNCLDSQRNLNYQLSNNSCSNTTVSNYSNVIMSNYANATNNESSFCPTNNNNNNNGISNCTNQLNQSNNNNLINEELNKDNDLNGISNQTINCTTTPVKPFTRVTLKSESPNLVIATDSYSYKNSTADDSQNALNSLNADDEDDDVFIKPTEINAVTASISSPKNNFQSSGCNINKKQKSHINLSSGTYLATGTNAHSSANLPQVDFTHPQQPKLASSAINMNKDDRKVEHHLNDINLNQIKFSSLEKEKHDFDLVSSSSTEFKSQINSENKQQSNRTNSPKRTKHRPEPLYIPPHVNARIHKSSRVLSAINDASNLTYTPPPMLSPVRFKTKNSLYDYL